jgi:hypothetical protein
MRKPTNAGGHKDTLGQEDHPAHLAWLVESNGSIRIWFELFLRFETLNRFIRRQL